MGKELTNRQLAEALGSALDQTERNIKQSVKKLESERERIESFSINTEELKNAYNLGNKNLKETVQKLLSEVERVKKIKPKSDDLKSFFLYIFMFIATIGSLSFGLFKYFDNEELVKQNAELRNTFNTLQQFFDEEPKAKNILDEWNNKR